MSYTADDLDIAIAKLGYSGPNRKQVECWEDYVDEGWSWAENRFYFSDGPFETEYGTVRKVDDFGGEGLGNQYWLVVSVTDDAGEVRHFKRCGYHQSHYGSELDGPTLEVEPAQQTITVWNTKEESK
ncbi:hypothetical protein SEA_BRUTONGASTER_9 [Gordonia phage BrutonGaster]|uniref:Uncharacterized protein n=1 Tax=Gordonia phage BrutonGaster TaxID=2530116 RepID=A0A482JHI5_9CAUD|nr:hypothetical protein HOV26_gp009 [Gordonia phage BrutonGaster]QBP33231.1 hypothetical protein SEA_BRUTONGASTER_9 [Gordonia phage BrutonGaster]